LFTELNIFWLLISLVSYFLFYVVGEGIFLHRYFSHGAFKCKDWVAKTGSVFAALGAFGTPISYRLMHVAHHSFSDTSKDPHSPSNGFWEAFIGWQLHDYKGTLSLLVAKRLYAVKFYRDLELHSIKLWWLFMLLTSLIDWRVPLFIALGSSLGMLISSFTNSAGHCWGSRRFETKDNSRNFAWLSWICWQGSGALQNNHHAYPSRIHDSHAWYEFDIGKYLIPILVRI
jgi:stearoyl-CoA desaturase (delta-9 desaturase)